jgi:N-acetylglucosaminyl-diphospho-decaprenol L-rhamnosyltransferase
MTMRCCRAVLASMPPGTEVIVVDDGSTDGTAQSLPIEAPDVRVIRLESNGGFARAANRGVDAASGHITLLLNSDAIVEDGALVAFVSAFDATPRLGIAGASLRNDDGTPQWSGGATPTLPWMLAVVSGAGPMARMFRRKRRRLAQCEVDWVSGAAMAFRREVWQAAGPLDERFLFYCQDIEFCLRARRAEWTVAVIDSAQVIHAIGGTVAGTGELRHDPARLWPDLLQWGAGHYGQRWAARARVVLVTAAWMRIAFRSLRRRDETTAALIRGARALWAGRAQRSDS